jgi:hypothetical protein
MRKVTSPEKIDYAARCGSQVTPISDPKEYVGCRGLEEATRDLTVLDRGRRFVGFACVLAALLRLPFLDLAAADEAGVSFWLQGQYASFAAAPSNPGDQNRVTG